MTATRRQVLRFGLAMTAALVWMVSGCSESPVSTEPSSPVSILRRPALGKPTGEETLEGSTTVTGSQGGAILLGDGFIGNSSIEVPTDAVDNPVLIEFIKMKVNKVGDVAAELRPHGLKFRKAAVLVLSYKGADLIGIDETKLRIYYLNENTGAWELVPNSVPDPEKDLVRAPLWHFSRYAIGGEG